MVKETAYIQDKYIFSFILAPQFKSKSNMFDIDEYKQIATVGIMTASLLAAVIGMAILATSKLLQKAPNKYHQ